MPTYSKALKGITAYQRRWLDAIATRRNRYFDDRDASLSDGMQLLEQRSDDVYPAIVSFDEDLAGLAASALTGLVLTGTNLVDATTKASGISDEDSATKELTWTRIVPGDEDITVTIASSGVANNTVTAAWDDATLVLTVTRGTTATAADVETAIPLNAAAKFIVAVEATGDGTGVPTAGDTAVSGGDGTLPVLQIGAIAIDGSSAGNGITAWTDTAVTFNVDASALTAGSAQMLRLWVDNVLVLNVPLTAAAGSISSSEIADGAITTSKLAVDALAESAAGRAKMADDFFDSATALAKFAVGSLNANTCDSIFAAQAIDGAKLKDTDIPSTKLQTQMVAVSAVAAADAGNTVDVTINVTDLEGAAVSRAQVLLCELFTADMVPALVASWTLAETGVGAEVSTTAKPSLLISTDASGDATVRITDVATGTNADLFLKVTPLSSTGPGFPTIVAINFDA